MSGISGNSLNPDAAILVFVRFLQEGLSGAPSYGGDTAEVVPGAGADLHERDPSRSRGLERRGALLLHWLWEEPRDTSQLA